MPQTSSGLLSNSKRPGLQAVLLERRQHDRGRGRGRQAQRQKGASTPAAAALFAASGPATASMAPLPNSSGFLERRFSIR